MKKVFLFGILSVALLTSCNNSAKQELENEKAMNEATREELQSAIAERDELLDIINEITSNVDEIRNVEKIITVNGVGETNSKTELNNSLEAIKNSLAERREKLAQLESKLKDSKLTNSKLLETIESLKKQIDDQQQQIELLTASLDNANLLIGRLNNSVDSLNTTVRNVTAQRDEAQELAKQQTDLANECYYAIGSKKELKEHDILEGGGFLRKSKIMQSDFDKSFFTKADKRTLTAIQLHSKKAKIVTSAQPSGSYEIVDVNGQKVLRILKPAEFWGTSNFVVIQID